MEKINMAIVGSHVRFRNLLVSFLKESPQKYEVLFEAENDELLFKQLEQKIPDVLLFDLETESTSGLETLQLLNKKYPAVKVIVNSISVDEATATAVIKSGACGFLTKNADDEEMHNAILSVFDNEFCYSEKIANKLLKHHFVTCIQAEKVNISFDEIDLKIIKFRTLDYTWDEIKEEMSLSVSALKIRMGKIIIMINEKGHNIKGLASLAVFVYKNNIIE